jgi:hypothetical protein
MGSSQSSYASKNDTKNFSAKKSRSSSSRIRGRKSINKTTYQESPHGLRSSLVSIPSERLQTELDVTSPESVHSDDVENHQIHEELINKMSYDEETDTESEEDGRLDINFLLRFRDLLLVTHFFVVVDCFFRKLHLSFRE